MMFRSFRRCEVMQDLESRIVALEQANRRYRFLFLAAAVGAVAMVICGAGSRVADKVQAKAFEVVSDSGAVLATVAPYEGNGSVTTYNSQGKILTDVVATKSGAGGIVTYDGAGNQNLTITDVKGGG